MQSDACSGGAAVAFYDGGDGDDDIVAASFLRGRTSTLARKERLVFAGHSWLRLMRRKHSSRGKIVVFQLLGQLKADVANRPDGSGSFTAAGAIGGEIKIHIEIHRVFLLVTVKIMERRRRKCNMGDRSMKRVRPNPSDMADNKSRMHARLISR